MPHEGLNGVVHPQFMKTSPAELGQSDTGIRPGIFPSGPETKADVTSVPAVRKQAVGFCKIGRG